MIRGFPIQFVLVILFILWVCFSLSIGFCIPRLKGRHIKTMLYGFGAAIAGLMVTLTIISMIVVFFN